MPPSPQRTDSERNALLLAHYPLARQIAQKVHHRLPPSLELDDLVSTAVLGLMEAIDRFDEDRGVPFGPYARHRIRGAVLDAVRAQDWTPRSVRQRAHRLHESRQKLLERLGRAPTRSEVASELGLTDARLERMERRAVVRKVVSLDAPARGDGPPLRDRISGGEDPTDRLHQQELKAAVLEAHQTLPARERQAITLHYLREMKLREVGVQMGVTESRVCQLCKRGIQRLRKRLTPGTGSSSGC